MEEVRQGLKKLNVYARMGGYPVIMAASLPPNVARRIAEPALAVRRLTSIRKLQREPDNGRRQFFRTARTPHHYHALLHRRRRAGRHDAGLSAGASRDQYDCAGKARRFLPRFSRRYRASLDAAGDG